MSRGLIDSGVLGVIAIFVATVGGLVATLSVIS